MSLRTIAPLGLAAVAFAGFSAAPAAHAAFLSLGTSNPSNAPTTLTGSSAGPELSIVNTNASNPALKAQATGSAAGAFGLYGLLTASSPAAASAAVRGQNNATNATGYGVWGSQAGGGAGIYGTSMTGNGVTGVHTATSGIAAGVGGTTKSTAPNASGLAGVVSPSGAGTGSAGVRGANSSSHVNTYGVWGSQNASFGAAGVFGNSTDGYGVVGASNSFDGVLGLSGTTTNPHTGGGYVTAVWGDAGSSFGSGVVGTSASAPGVFGSATSGIGVDGTSTDYYGVYGTSTSSYAGWFQGNVNITGTLTSGVKDFQIDDPLDPAHKYLRHTSVESSDMMNIYNGNVRTDGKGFATVTMPRWFQALNRTFRYQLTVIGRSFAQAIVWTPIHGNRFTLRTNQPRVKVSWQVTGIRHDPYANANRTQVVAPKPKTEQGKYLYPQGYGKSRKDGIGYQHAHLPPRVTFPKH